MLYMKSNLTKFKKNKLLLSVSAALLAASLFTFASCDEDVKTDNTTVKVDTAVVTNGNFENYSDDDQLKLINTPTGWSNGVDSFLGYSASSSSAASGIVNTDGDSWNSLTQAKNPIDFEPYKVTEKKDGKDVTYYNVQKAMDDAEKKWSEMSVNDRLKFYHDVKEYLEDYNEVKDEDLALSDFAHYSDYNYSIDYDDVPDCKNPGTHEGAKAGEKSVLMIHNYRSDKNGTAQKYTSSHTITLQPGTAAELSLWVKTDALTYNNGQVVSGNRGAYINVDHTVGGQSLDDMEIKNINTKGEWKQYTVYLKASPYATSTFTVVLGLGHGSSSSSGGNRFEYVQGYAFFDDVDVKIVNPSKIQDKIDSLGDYTCNIDDESKAFETDKPEFSNAYEYALDLSVDDAAPLNPAFDIELTYTEENGKKYSVTEMGDLSLYKGLTSIDTKKDVTKVNTFSKLKDNANLLEIMTDEDYFKNDTFVQDGDKVLMLYSAYGAPYTATLKNDSLFTLEANETSGTYALLSFWVKTYDTNGYDAATITLYDATTHVSSSITVNTTTVATTDIDDEKDLNSGWVQCFFFVSNTTDEDQSFYVDFSYGKTTITGNNTDYHEGFAAFTKFEYTPITSFEYGFAGSTSYSSAVSLTGNVKEYSGFDKVAAIDSEKIKETVATPANYTGVYGGSAFTTGEKLATLTDEEYNGKNVNKNAGVIDTKYLDGYRNEAWKTTELLNRLTEMSAANNFTCLLISNVVEKSYGYYANSASNLSTNGYNAISINVFASKGAKAYIYLVDNDEDSDNYNKALTVSTVPVTYWYDDEGNICDKSPDAENFNKKRNTIFELNRNGLYTINEDSDYYDSLSTKPEKDAYFANFYNYEKDKNGNLLAEKDSSGKPVVTYKYSDDYKDDGIAFYYNNGKYYAYSDFTTEVQNIPQDFTAGYARYVSKEQAETLGTLGEDVYVTGKTSSPSASDVRSCIVVDGDTTGGKWVTVNFYVKTGSKSLPYRLELFSGSRDGKVKSKQGSYVLFRDDVSTPDISTNYSNLLSEAIDEVVESDNNITKDPDTGRLLNKDGSPYGGIDYYTYTFYDDAAYQRYDLTLDEDNAGNRYSGYVQSNQSEGVTYFYHETEKSDSALAYTMFLDYTTLYQSVEAVDIVEEEAEETDKWWEDPDFWLMLSSILLAVVLLIVMIAMFISRIIVNARKAKANKQSNRYDATRKRYIKRLNLQTEEEEATADETVSAESNEAQENESENPNE